MTPAEFKALREGLGLSERDVSMLTMAKEAQIKAWEQGLEDVPEAEGGLLMDIEREVERRLAEALKRALARDAVTLKRFKSPLDFKKTGPDMSPIPSMLAYRCHSALIGRLYRALRRAGRDVTIIYS
ncbi:hypothetical protein [Kordiimonas lacus]|uniref:Uncharacterized protein n=1 Tax=Kordiimonas lacus TaxID=637679 RepID=A0A1G6YEY6_9PROT|nr:hypothetical protein [Kordiimonas lacus]SDD88126.1 hypothetical protein SAMN04488071_1573 [Kordiimonas lacus]